MREAAIFLTFLALCTTVSSLTTLIKLDEAQATSCRRSHDIFFTSFGEITPYQLVSMYYTSRSQDATIHHIILDNSDTHYANERIGRMYDEFYMTSGVKRIQIDMANVNGYNDLNAHYIHSSTNGRDYEFLCFARFLAMYKYCRDAGIETFTHLDADIAVFDPDFLGSVCIPHGYDAWYLFGGSSFLSTVTCRHVGKFADYILKFYVRDRQEDVVRDIVKHGDKNMFSDAKKAEVVVEVPAYTRARLEPAHLSDMYMLGAYLAGSGDGKPRAYVHQTVHGHISKYLEPFGNLRSLHPNQRETMCRDKATFQSLFGLNMTHKLVRVQDEWRQLHGGHFQGGDCKERLVEALGGPVAAMVPGMA